MLELTFHSNRLSPASMIDLLKTPLCSGEDIGRPLPDSPHAVSVCLPLWEQNVGYEESDPGVVERMQCGYPRFFLHPLVLRLFEKCEQRFAQAGECCFAFPTRRAAERCAAYIRSTTGESSSIHDFGAQGLFALSLPRSSAAAAKAYWQHTGEIVSSRLAVAALEGSERIEPSAAATRQQLRVRIAELAGARRDDVYLFPNGMAAIFCAYRVLRKLRPQLKSVQFGFPYVDALKIQQQFGSGVHLFAKGNAAELDSLQELLAGEQVMALFCEFPSNPLLHSPDLAQLNQLAAEHNFPLVVDDTLGACINTDLLPASDLLVTSLTKFFSGAGDVMGGSLILNSQKPFYDRFKAGLTEEYEDQLFPGDAVVLEGNSRDVVERVRKINQNTEELCEMIRRHPAVARVDYPKYNSTENYRAFLREGGGYGGLFSIQLRDAARNAPLFFDALEICKGPNLGTNFSLCCPYTILAHYNELDFAERCNISQYLLRVSIGLEEIEWLKARFQTALNELPAPRDV